MSDASVLSDRLLRWYDRHARVLPWRLPPGPGAGRPDPYRVWLSEVMLQQTTVVAVAPYYQDFLARWPTVHALAEAELGRVLEAWAGLGYYARARNLHKCARVVSAEHAGRFPDTEAGLRALPGIGRYTAAAIAAIAFERPATVVDGNIERVIARLFAVAEPLPGVKSRLYDLAATLTPSVRPGDHAQALMDLGATICTPRRPRCMLCPWQETCAALAAGCAEDLPARAPKLERPLRRGVAYWLVREDGAVLLRRRPEHGLLGGMMEVPSSDWLEDRDPQAPDGAPVDATWRALPGMVRHGFTHFRLELSVMAGGVANGAVPEGTWVLPDRLGEQALPTLMRKVVRHALAHTGRPEDAG